ncbi:MAG: hypothetical protein IJH04_04135, partial [Eggerthellaceae bacterium]|nr:hypothetical protein [Eggerthellaceae bacterium]
MTSSTVSASHSKARSIAGFGVSLLLGALCLLCFALPSRAYAEKPPLEVVGTPTVSVVTGGKADLAVTVKNTSSELVDFIDIWDSTAIGTGEDAWTPYIFQDDRESPEPEGAEVTWTMDASYYGLAAGKTATFYVRVRAYDLAPGTYNHFIQLANWGWEVTEWNEWGWPVASEKKLNKMYSDKIPVKLVVYNPADAALTVGKGENLGATVTAFPASGIDLGTIDLTKTDESALKKELPFFIKNTSPTVDSRTGARPDITLVSGTSMSISGFGADYMFPISYSNGYGLYSYDTTLGPDAPFSVSLSVDASYFIAGTYKANIDISTIPHKVKVNSAAGKDSGSYSIPVTVKLTGTNPRLPKRASDAKASPGNNQVELTWKSPSSDISYYVYRREGAESKTDPDTWTADDWAKYEKLNFNEVFALTDGSYLYVDGTAKNGTTYSYVVIGSEPFMGYASTPVKATPKSSYKNKLQRPEVFVNEKPGGVTLSWRMNDNYGSNNCDGAGMVDHFNVYRDGVLVTKIYQSAVVDDSYPDWIEGSDG